MGLWSLGLALLAFVDVLELVRVRNIRVRNIRVRNIRVRNI